MGVAAFFGYQSFSKSAPPAYPQDIKVVEVEPVSIKNIGETSRFIGTIKPERSTILVARAAGILESLVQPGQKVSKGMLIAKIDNADIEKNYNLSESAEKIAKTQYDRAQKLLEAGLFSKNNVEEKKNLWIQAQKNLANAKIDLNRIKFHAPFNGVVGVFKVREGSQVREGDSIVSFYDPSSLVVEFDIPASLVNLVHEGQPVHIDSKMYTLDRMQKMVDEETHMCPAYTNITCDHCVIGSSVNVDLEVQKKDTIVIPYESVFLRDSKPYVYVAKDNKAVLKPVELGIRDKEQVEITSGLEPGEKVIIRGQARLYPEIAIQIHNPSPEGTGANSQENLVK